MLGDYPVDVMLLATDLGMARRFYAGTLDSRCCWKTSSSSPSGVGATAG